MTTSIVNIDDELSHRLDLLKQEQSNRIELQNSKVVIVDLRKQYAWEELLSKIKNDQSGPRYVLIACQVESSYWIGILILFGNNDRIQTAELIDPVEESSFDPNYLQQQFTKYYPNDSLIFRTIRKHSDTNFSANLTIENLIEAIEQCQTNENMTSSPIPFSSESGFNEQLESSHTQQSSVCDQLDSMSQLDFSLNGFRQNQERMSISGSSIGENNSMDIESLTNLYTDSKNMPPCLEKSLHTLLFLIGVKRSDQTTNLDSCIVVPDDLDAEIDKTYDLLKEQAAKREIQPKDIQKLINSSHVNARQQNWKFAQHYLKKVLKSVRSLDIQELLRLIKKVDDAAVLIEDKDILLLLGVTGSGKSTTIHYLGGSAMTKEIVNGTVHFQPTDIINEDLRQVTTSARAKSDTRHIIPVRIRLDDDDDLDSNENIILCDTPGFEDTNSAEVDIANGLSIIKAIQGCRSVRPVVVVSYRSIGDRFQGLRNLAHILAGLLPGMADHIRCFSFVFTKYPEDERRIIHESLKNIRKDFNEIEKSDTSFRKIFDRMIEKTKKRAIAIDLTDRNQRAVLNELMESESIEHPNEVFHFSIAESSRKIVQEQARKYQSSIFSATKSFDYLLVKYKLDELKQLTNLLNDKKLEQIYNECTDFVRQHLTQEYEQSIKDLDRCLKHQTTISDDDIKQYQTKINQATLAEDLRNEHLDTTVVQTSSFIQYLNEQIKNMVDRVQNKEINYSSMKIILDKILLVSKYFPKFQSDYNSIVEHLLEEFNLTMDSYKKSVRAYDFDQCVNDLKKLSAISNLIENGLQIKYEKVDAYFLRYLRDTIENFEPIFQQQNLDKTIVDNLLNCFNTLEKALETYTLHEFISKDEIKIIYKQLREKVSDYFRMLIENIDSLIREENGHLFEIAESKIKNLNILQTIPIVQLETNQLYNRTLEKLLAYIRQSTNYVESQLIKFRRNDDETNYIRLAQYLSNLKYSKWIERYFDNVHINMMKDIEESLMQHLAKLKNKFAQINLDLENYQQIESANKIVSEINEMSALIGIFDCLKNHIDEVDSSFIKATTKILDIIKESYSIDYWRKQRYQLLDFDRIEKSLLYLNACRNAVRLSRDGDSAIVLISLQNFIQDFNNFIHDEIGECLDQIKACSNNNLMKNIRIIFNRLREITEIKRVCPKMFACFTNNKIFESWTQELSRFADDLREDLDTLKLTKQTEKISSKLTIVKELRRIDEFLDEKKFSNLFNEYQTTFLTQTKTAETNVIDAIKKHDYPRIYTEMKVLQGSGEIGEQALQQAQHLTRVDIELLMDETNYKVMFGDKIDPDEIRLIESNLKKIQWAGKLLDSYIHMSTEIDNFIKATVQSLSQRIERFLTKIHALINASDFAIAQQQIDVIMTIRDILGKNGFCTNEISNKISQLNDYEEQAIMNLTRLYETLTVDEYSSYSPRIIFEKLDTVRTARPVFGEAQERIKRIIMDKCRAEIGRVATRIVNNPQDVHVERLKTAFRQLPNDLRVGLEQTLDHTIKDCQQTIVNNNKQINEVFHSQDVQKIKSLLIEYKNTPGQQIFVDKGRELTIEHMQTFAGEIFENLKQYNIREALINTKNFYDYKNELKDFIGETSQLNFDVDVRIKETFERAYSYIENQFFFANMSNITNEIIQNVEKCFVCLLEFMIFRDEPNNQLILSKILPNNFDSNIQEFQQIFSNYISDIQLNYKNALKILSIQSLIDTLTIVSTWNSLFIKINDYKHSVNHTYQSIYPIISTLNDLSTYVQMTTMISETIITLIKQLIKIELINNATSEFNQQRNQFYKELNDKLLVVEQTQLLNDFKGIQNIDKNKQDCIVSYQMKLDIICKQISDFIEEISQNPRLNIREYDRFNLYYNNLFAFHEQIHVTFIQVNDKLKIKTIDQKILSLTQTWANTAETSTQVEEIARYLINMKRISNNLPLFQIRINNQIDIVLNQHKGKAQLSSIFTKLATLLNTDAEGIGQAIIAEHKAFQGFAISLFNVNVQRHGIGYILDNLEISSKLKDQLKIRYNEFNELYRKLISQYLKQNMQLDKLIADTKLIFGNTKQLITDRIVWDGPMKNKIPIVLAHVLAIWTLQNASHYFEAINQSNKNDFLVQPHAGQILAIFSMLGIAVEGEGKLNNNLVQVGTGEGKSVILAATSCVLVLAGFDVWCACYSEQLSTRDYKQFHSLFDTLGVLSHIHYGTFNKLSEDLINQHGIVREIVEEFISNNSTITINKNNQELKRSKILLVDEVDVFFSQDFYGNVYTPSAKLKDPTIVSLVEFIWSNRGKQIYFQDIKKSQQYIDCTNRFPNWILLIDEAIKDMLSDIKHFQSHDYIVKEDKIGYIEQDNFIFNLNYGYKTLFAYYYENENGKISRKSVEDYISIFIRCGSFSYAEMSAKFKVIMGVTGTLDTLNDIEKNIVQTQYKIRNFRVIPSVFGKTNLRFDEKDDVMIENQNDYFNKIKRQIENRIEGQNAGTKRAILVFFETKNKLMDFYNCEALAPIKHLVTYLTEEQLHEEKLHRIRNATVSGRITLFTKTFGRGTDFLCNDQTVAKNGGTHVIQTFLSETESEEVQIKGRTARQGDEGSYSLILLHDDLEKFHITQEHIQDIRDGKMVDGKQYNSVREFLKDKRRELFRIQHETNKKFVELAAEKHEKCEQFLKDLLSRDIAAVQKFLVEENRGVQPDICIKSRTICLMDATVSMGTLIKNCKATVKNMFERATTILQQNKISADSFQLQLVLFRNYNSDRNRILQYSSWETKPNNLSTFITPIQVEGGWGHEAIEIGLWHANNEHNKEAITQVIIIGDAAPNTYEEVRKKRERLGEQYWQQTDLKQATYYQDELAKLIANNIPVHCFYVDKKSETENSFQEIARQANGQCAFLEIHSNEGADKLTDFITKEILRNVGGNEFVKQYERTYPKTYL